MDGKFNKGDLVVIINPVASSLPRKFANKVAIITEVYTAYPGWYVISVFSIESELSAYGWHINIKSMSSPIPESLAHDPKLVRAFLKLSGYEVDE